MAGPAPQTSASTLVELLDEVLATDADREAFVEPATPDRARRVVTFAELAERSAALGLWLHRRGVRPGDVVALQLGNTIEYAVAYHAIVRAGAIATGVNPRLGPHEIGHIRRMADPVFTFDGPLPSLPAGDVAWRAERSPTDPLAIVWTGGTTGLPKGAWFDTECLRAMAEGAEPLSALGDRRLSPLPFSHVGFMTRAWDELAHRITTVICPTPWAAATTLAVYDAEGITVGQGVPTQYRMLFDHPAFASTDVGSLRIAGIGAARVQPELVAEMRAKLGCPVVHRYASTESCLATGTRLSDPPDIVATTVGRPNGRVELKIVDDDGAELASGETGTICLRSRAMMRGYWGDAERSAEAIDADGWLRTGDLGWVGDDGNLRIAGRRTEMYIRGGYNVYPIEVENCLGDHVDVAAAAVVGSPVADRLGEIGVLFVVARPGRHPDLGELRRFTRERLADYKAPDVLVVVDSLPLTSIGKIDKKALQPLADDAASTWRRPGA